MEIIKPSEESLKKTIEIIQRGGVIVCPTDTVYGFLADAANKKAVEKIFKIKKRPRQKPLPVFVRDFKMAKKLARIDEKQEKILKKYWPGKYTFILKRRPGTKLFGINRKTIALRIPKYKFLDDLLRKINKPLVQTSVNISGKPASTKIGEVLKQFKLNKVVRKTSDRLFYGQLLIALVIDAGDLPKRKPSVIIDLTLKHLTRLR